MTLNIKYMGENAIAYLIEKCKSTFALITHKHTAQEIGADVEGSASAALVLANQHTEEKVGELAINVAYIDGEDNEDIVDPDIEMSDVVVDSALSETSMNPVQNKVVTAKINELEENIVTSWNELEDKPFGEGTTYVTYAEGEVSTDSEHKSGDGVFHGYLGAGYKTIEEGKTYNVTIDGVLYENIVCSSGDQVLQNSDPTLGSSYGELRDGNAEYPFKINFTDYYDIYIVYTKGNASHSVKIEEVVSSVKQIEEKYIPDTIARIDHSHSWNDLEDRPFHDEYIETVFTITIDDMVPYGNNPEEYRAYMKGIIEFPSILYGDCSNYAFLFNDRLFTNINYLSGYGGNWIATDKNGVELTVSGPLGDDKTDWAVILGVKTEAEIIIGNFSIIKQAPFKQIDEKFIPEHSHVYIEDYINYIEILPETTVTIDSDGGYESLPNMETQLEKDVTYYVTLNGVKYECIAREYNDGDIIIGNGIIYGDGIVGNNEPFSCDSYSDGSIYLNSATAGTYTISISVAVEGKKIKPEYLPEHSHSWNELKDRPFHDEYIETVFSMTVDMVQDSVGSNLENYRAHMRGTGIEYPSVLESDYQNCSFLFNGRLFTNITYQPPGYAGVWRATDANGVELSVTGHVNDDDKTDWVLSLYGKTEAEKIIGDFSIIKQVPLKQIDKKFIPNQSWNDLTDKPTKDDALALLMEVGMVDPVVDNNGAMYTDNNNMIYTF